MQDDKPEALIELLDRFTDEAETLFGELAAGRELQDRAGGLLSTILANGARLRSNRYTLMRALCNDASPRIDATEPVVAALAHDFSSHLLHICTPSEILSRHPDVPAWMQELAERVLRSIDRLRRFRRGIAGGSLTEALDRDPEAVRHLLAIVGVEAYLARLQAWTRDLAIALRLRQGEKLAELGRRAGQLREEWLPAPVASDRTDVAAALGRCSHTAYTSLTLFSGIGESPHVDRMDLYKSYWPKLCQLGAVLGALAAGDVPSALAFSD